VPSTDVTSIGPDRFVIHGNEKIIAFPQACKELGWTGARLAGMEADCPYLDDGILLIRIAWLPMVHKLPRGNTVTADREIRYLVLAKYEELTRQLADVRTGRFTLNGVTYLSAARSMKELKLSTKQVANAQRSRQIVEADLPALREWHNRGCRYLGGERLGARAFKFKESGKGPGELWFEEEHVLRIKMAILNFLRSAKEESNTFGPTLRRAREKAGLTQGAVCDATGYSRSNLSHWENGRQLPKLSTAVALAKAIGVALTSLRFPRKRPKRPRPPHQRFDGIFRDRDQVVGYNLSRAAIVSGFSEGYLLNATKKLNVPFDRIFPNDGRLPSELMLVPGTCNCWHIAVTPGDLEILNSEISKILVAGERQAKALLSNGGICDLHGVKGRAHQKLVSKFVNGLANRNIIRRELIPLRTEVGDNSWAMCRRFYPTDIERSLAGEPLLGTAKEFARNPSCGRWPKVEVPLQLPANDSEDATSVRRKRPGRVKGWRSKDAADRNKRIRDSVARKEYPTCAATARAFGVDRKVVYDALDEKRGTNSSFDALVKTI
jgi:putative transcriptional regulator